MKKHLDLLDLKILEAIGADGPRNLNTVATKLGIKDPTLRARLKRLKSTIFLHINVYHTFIGLRKVCVFLKAVLGKEKLLFDSLKAHGYWLYVSRCYGAFEGCFALYAIPPKFEDQFLSFLEQLKLKSISQSYKLFWSTCFHTVNPTTNWFDVQSDNWIFPWDEWTNEIGEMDPQSELPYSLIDPIGFPVKADYIDIFTLKELEVDATRSFRSIASKLGVTLQTIKYHFDNHIIKRKLLESYQVVSSPFSRMESDLYLFTLRFPGQEELAKFAISLLNKPFARSIGKIHGKYGLLVQFDLPRREFRRMIDAFSTLIQRGILLDYWYVIEDRRFVSRQTIPYKLFSKSAWKYDQKDYLQELDTIVKN